MSELRRCILTSFKWAHCWDLVLKDLYDSGKVAYCNGQLELSDSGREHLQAYVEFNTKMKFNALKNLIDDQTVHIEQVKIDNGASNYAMKEETRLDGPIEYGKKKGTCKDGGGDRKSLTYI